MKACILAGGLGTRLRPLTCTRPKPMLPLFDKPILAYTLASLKKAGVESVFITLMYLPDSIRNAFGEKYEGMDIHYLSEKEALGTAGGVSRLRERLSDDDFIVISGDAAFDLDLSEAVRFHKAHAFDATLLLSASTEPVSYGVVDLAEDGRVRSLSEKPAWERVGGDTVNTGLYVFSPHIFSHLHSDGARDFAKDVFPPLIREGKLGGILLKGYWRDLGTPESYLHAMFDALDKKWIPPLPITSAPLPEGTAAPSYISPEAKVLTGAKIGPYAILQAGASVGKGSEVTHASVAAKSGENCGVYGAIMDKGSRLGSGSVVMQGAVVGEGAVIGEGCSIAGGVRIWCDAMIEDGVLTESGKNVSGLAFRRRITVSRGRITGLSPLDAMQLAGSLLSAFGKKIAVGVDRHSAFAVSLSEAFVAAATSLRAHLFRHDATFAAEAAYAGTLLSADLSLWFGCGHAGCEILIYNRNGVLLSPEESRFPLLSFEKEADGFAGCSEEIRGIPRLYASEAGRHFSLESTVFTNDVRLVPSLLAAGVKIADSPEGNVILSADTYGERLSLVSEKGYHFTEDEVFLLVLLADFLTGANTAAIPYTAPSAAEALAADCGKELLRVGRDRKADLLYSASLHYHHAAYAALLILSAMEKTGRTLSSLSASIPSSASILRDFHTGEDRTRVMELFLGMCEGMHVEKVDGIRVCVDGAYVTLRPSPFEKLLTLKAESRDEETASELCAFYFDKLRRAAEKP
ncbi:MAG: NTP transferase domain-containing protein [Clostridia bacterium]|nr:NTP transferase domain-containing protein [Clostridia bacterium]